MSMLLKLWGQSSGVHQCRVRAGERRQSSIFEPSVTLLGTAVPSMYFAAMTPSMLSNGFFARMMLFEAGVRSPAQDTRHRELPKSVIRDTEKWGDLCRRMRTDQRPDLITAREGKGTDVVWRTIQKRGDELYHEARLRDDEGGKALWARFSEKARKLALLYACSVSATKPTITTDGLRWASQVVEYSTNLMLYHAERHVTSSQFAAKCAKVMTRVETWFNTKGVPIPGFEIARSFDSRPSDLDDVLEMLSDQHRIFVETVPTPGRSGSKVWPFLQYQKHLQRQMMN
jgi:hypothetical protein